MKFVIFFLQLLGAPLEEEFDVGRKPRAVVFGRKGLEEKVALQRLLGQGVIRGGFEYQQGGSVLEAGEEGLAILDDGVGEVLGIESLERSTGDLEAESVWRRGGDFGQDLGIAVFAKPLDDATLLIGGEIAQDAVGTGFASEGVWSCGVGDWGFGHKINLDFRF